MTYPPTASSVYPRVSSVAPPLRSKLDVVRKIGLLLAALALTPLFGCSVGPQVDPVWSPNNSFIVTAVELHPRGTSTEIRGAEGATMTVETVVAENLTLMGEPVMVSPADDGSFSVTLPGQPDHVYRLTPISLADMTGFPVEVTADSGGGPARDVTPVDEGSAIVDGGAP